RARARDGPGGDMTTAPPPAPTPAVPKESADREVRQYRELLATPDRWEGGFDVKSIVGGLFVGMIMTPASMYMQLVVGSEIGTAAQWVTIILFMEVARRAFTVLTRPEIFVLYYMAGACLVNTGPGKGLLWQQFMVQSESFRQFGLADKIPAWIAPSSPDVLGLRSFFNPGWYAPIGLIILGHILARVDNFGLGYVLYRLTSDVEKLPYPMAPVGAQGVTALADASRGEETWRWRVFSFGAMLGIAFAAVYLALPSITGAFLPEPISMIAFPFKDLTSNTEDFLPAVPIIIALDLGLLISGMVLPFWAMAGSFIGLVACMVLNPVLYHYGILSSWVPGLGAVRTLQSNTLDFYFSFGLGLTAAIAVVGIWHVASRLIVKREGRGQTNWRALFTPPPGRGDFSVWIALFLYFAVTASTIILAYMLLRQSHLAGIGSPVTMTLLGIFAFYGFVYTPIIGYVSARMEGVVGQNVQLPLVREAALLMTGYQGAAIWFVPFPANNHGNQALYFRKTELTGTKITSMIKAELFILPVILIATVVFSHLIWRIAPVPSSAFPYAEQWWELSAYKQGLIYSSTLPGGGGSHFAQAFHGRYLFAGLGGALLLYSGLASFGLPVMLFYGIIRGLDQSAPHVILPQFIGALLGRKYFQKKFGERWKPYIIVFFAGYSCGVGLIMMFSLGCVFMSKSVFQRMY
ncbi:MAG TPA: hypothetical protein VLI90_08095, partial [Tepidisphaeraceae bacterium]|nr:hypothetical protein [Tepidisphaeraceae bacterium]